MDFVAPKKKMIRQAEEDEVHDGITCSGLGVLVSGCRILVCEKFSSIYLEDHPRTDGYVLNNHGDRVRPRRIGLFPFQMGLFMAYKGGWS